MKPIGEIIDSGFVCLKNPENKGFSYCDISVILISFSNHPYFYSRIVIPMMFILISLMSITIDGWAQDTDTPAEEDSTQVDESEEQYRRRMELEEARTRVDDILRQNSSTNTSPPEGIDRLPPESQRHLRDQLKKVIMSNGEWTPQDAGKEYPYEPSEAAKSDPELQKIEEEAWADLVAEYHEREAAVHASPGTQGSGDDDISGGQSGNAGQSGAGGQTGKKGDSGGGSSSGQKSPQKSPQQSSSSEDEGPSTAGTSQSALDFLKGMMGGGNSEETPEGTSEGTAPSEAQDTDPQGNPQEADPSQSSEQTQTSSEDNKEQTTPPAGSLAISDLQKLGGTSAESKDDNEPEASVDSEQTPESDTRSEQPPQEQESSEQPPAGVIAITELQRAQALEKNTGVNAQANDDDRQD